MVAQPRGVVAQPRGVVAQPRTGSGAAGSVLDPQNWKMDGGPKISFSNWNPFDKSLKTGSGAVGPILQPRNWKMRGLSKSCVSESKSLWQVTQNWIWSYTTIPGPRKLEMNVGSKNNAFILKSLRQLLLRIEGLAKYGLAGSSESRSRSSGFTKLGFTESSFRELGFTRFWFRELWLTNYCLGN